MGLMGIVTGRAHGGNLGDEEPIERAPLRNETGISIAIEIPVEVNVVQR
jgi:hypothetical protein